MDEFSRHEYKTLRATITQRGTVRAITFLVAIAMWAALGLLLLTSGHPIVAPLLPLMVLVAGFETVFQLNLGVERVGRYVQVAYEESHEWPAGAAPGWETAAMAYGQAYPSAGSDPLFARIFLLATLANLIPVLHFRADRPAVVALLLLAHVAFGVRVLLAKRRAGRQRAEDLARFRELLARK
jgi:hypothetical protein